PPSARHRPPGDHDRAGVSDQRAGISVVAPSRRRAVRAIVRRAWDRRGGSPPQRRVTRNVCYRECRRVTARYTWAMNRFVCIVVALAACHNESRPDPKTGGDVEARLKRLEDDNAKYKAELEWLNSIYQQQMAQQEQEEREQPAPDAV